jgi:hypothetical protein
VTIEEGRKKEFGIALRFSLKKIANRIDSGFNIKVRAEPVKESDTTEGDQTQSESIARHHATFAQTAKTLQFMKLDGAPILSLAESSTEEAAKPKK